MCPIPPQGSRGKGIKFAVAPAGKSATRRKFLAYGRVAERFKAPVLKTGVGASPPWVRIPPLPPLKGPPMGAFIGGTGFGERTQGSIKPQTAVLDAAVGPQGRKAQG